MPSRQESSSPSASTSTKRSGHQRNPMACTNCRARKIKCDSNRQFPDRPCQRCVTRKLHCEYVAISHSPTNDTFQRSGPFNTASSPLQADYAKRPLGYTPSNSPPHLLPRYSPNDHSSIPRSSKDLSYSQSPSNSYNSFSNSPSHYSSLETTSLYPYDPSYTSSPGFDPTITSAPMSQVPNISSNLRVPGTRYGGVPSGMPTNAALDAGQWFGQNSGDWSSHSANTNALQEQYYYNSECRCTGIQCICGNHRYPFA